MCFSLAYLLEYMFLKVLNESLFELLFWQISISSHYSTLWARTLSTYYWICLLVSPLWEVRARPSEYTGCSMPLSYMYGALIWILRMRWAVWLSCLLGGPWTPQFTEWTLIISTNFKRRFCTCHPAVFFIFFEPEIFQITESILWSRHLLNYWIDFVVTYEKVIMNFKGEGRFFFNICMF